MKIFFNYAFNSIDLTWRNDKLIIRGIINDRKQKIKKRRNNSADSLKLVFAIACQIDQIDDSMRV